MSIEVKRMGMSHANWSAIVAVICCFLFFPSYIFALTSDQIISSLPAKHTALKDGVQIKLLGKDYIERRVLDNNKQSYLLITTGTRANEQWFNGTPGEYALLIHRRLAPSSGIDAAYWQKQLTNLDELGKTLNPRNARVASSLFYSSRIGFDLGTAMVSGGVSGLTFVGSSMQFLKQTAIGPKPKDLVWIYIACKNLDYLKMVEKELPAEKVFFAKVYEGVGFGNEAVQFLKDIDETTKNINNIFNSAGWETLKGTSYAKVALADAFSGFGVSLTKTGVLWGLNKFEDELTRYMFIADVHIATLKTISDNLIDDISRLQKGSLTPAKEVALRDRILKQQMLYYNIYAELARAAYDFSIFARKEANWKGRVAISDKSLQNLQKSKKKSQDISAKYSSQLYNFEEELYRSLHYYGLMKTSQHVGAVISPLASQASNIAGGWSISTKLISHNCPSTVPVRETETFRIEYCQRDNKVYLWCDDSSVWGQVSDGKFSGTSVSTSDKRPNGFKTTAKWDFIIDKSGNDMTGMFTTAYNRNSDGSLACQKNESWHATRLKGYQSGKRK